MYADDLVYKKEKEVEHIAWHPDSLSIINAIHNFEVNHIGYPSLHVIKSYLIGEVKQSKNKGYAYYFNYIKGVKLPEFFTGKFIDRLKLDGDERYFYLQGCYSNRHRGISTPLKYVEQGKIRFFFTLQNSERGWKFIRHPNPKTHIRNYNFKKTFLLQ